MSSRDPTIIKTVPASTLRNMVIICLIIIIILIVLLVVAFLLYSATKRNLDATLNPDGTCKPLTTADL